MASELEEIDVPSLVPPPAASRRGGGVVSAQARRLLAALVGAAQSAPSSALRSFHEEGAIGKAYDTRLLRRLWPFVRPHARLSRRRR